MASGIGSVTSLLPIVHHNRSRQACQNFRCERRTDSPGTCGAREKVGNPRALRVLCR